MKNSIFIRILPFFGFVLAAMSAYILPFGWFGALALIAYLMSCGLALGSRLAPDAPQQIQLGLGAMSTVASMSILGSFLYYSATITTTGLLGVLFAICCLASLCAKPTETLRTPLRTPPVDALLLTIGLLSLVGWWIAILSVQINEPIRSLWLVLDPFSLIAIGCAAACVVALSIRNQSPRATFGLLAVLLFSGLSLASVLYHFGYGFDPFLHRATVSYIAEHGTITPKPLYYIGQYALELIGIKIFALPLFSLDVFLAPFLASLGIPLAFMARQSALKLPTIVLGSLLFLPFAAFIQTTPQALAFIYTAWALFSPTTPKKLPLLFAAAALITHPLAGIGAAIYGLFLLLDDLPKEQYALRIAITTISAIGASLAIPVAFAIQAKIAHLPLKFTLSHLFNLSQLPITGFLTTQYNAWGDTAYFFIGNAFLIILTLAIAGMVLMPKTTSGWYIPGLVALTIFINFVILSLGFDFTFLIAYERLDFALRLLTLTTLFLLPYLAWLFAALWKKLPSSTAGLRIGLAVLLSIFFITNVYGAYPRNDNYARSAGFNVGPSDFDAVSAIDQAADNQAYIVLSDQALAAAAVQDLGFKQYYHDNIFFYPIPTGGPLYQHFLTMVEDRPTRETVEDAMDLAGVDLAFFVVHNYWWQAPQIIENAKAVADDWFAIGNGAVTVFKFQR